MTQRNQKIRKIAQDYIWDLLSWSFVYVGVMIVIFIFSLIMSQYIGELTHLNFAEITLSNASLVFFIFGIVCSVNIFPQYIKLGLTRKTTLKGSIIGSLVASFLFILSVLLLFLLFTFIMSLFGISMESSQRFWTTIISSFVEQDLSSMTTGIFTDSLFAQLGQILIVIVTYWLLLVQYFWIGWLIGIGFYRFNFIRGMGILLLSLFLMAILPVMSVFNLVEAGLNIVLTENFIGNWSIYILTSILITFLTVMLVHFISKNMPIKLS